MKFRTLAAYTAALCATLCLTLTVAAAAENRPNILVVIADDWSNGHSSAQGAKWINTPAFDRVVKEGVLFKNAFTSNPKCSPCRASFLTGRN
ncbi:MAG: heparan N-sulfatase, partial [Verrucomicrobiaceae bacterium]